MRQDRWRQAWNRCLQTLAGVRTDRAAAENLGCGRANTSRFVNMLEVEAGEEVWRRQKGEKTEVLYSGNWPSLPSSGRPPNPPSLVSILFFMFLPRDFRDVRACHTDIYVSLLACPKRIIKGCSLIKVRGVVPNTIAQSLDQWQLEQTSRHQGEL